MEPSFEGKLGFDSTRVAAFLVLAISAPFSYEKNVHIVPPRIFSYAVTWLGRISYALSDVMNQETLLAYLSECSRSSTISLADFNIKEALPTVKGNIRTHLCSRLVVLSICPYSKNLESDNHPKLLSLGMSATHAEYEMGEHDELRKSINLIFRNVKDSWSLVQLGCTNEALKAMR